MAKRAVKLKSHAPEGASAPAPFAAPSWPADKIERRKVAALEPYARNSRQHSEEQVAQIAASIREWGWTIPVLVDESDTILAGHGRVLAAFELGIEEVPVIIARGWSKAKKAAYVIADNKLAENATWNRGMLRSELVDLRASGFDLELTGFGSADLVTFLAGATPPAEFPTFGADLPTDYCCPRCAYRWSGRPDAGAAKTATVEQKKIDA